MKMKNSHRDKKSDTPTVEHTDARAEMPDVCASPVCYMDEFPHYFGFDTVEKVRVADGAEDGRDAADADDGCGASVSAKPSNLRP